MNTLCVYSGIVKASSLCTLTLKESKLQHVRMVSNNYYITELKLWLWKRTLHIVIGSSFTQFTATLTAYGVVVLVLLFQYIGFQWA